MNLASAILGLSCNAIKFNSIHILSPEVQQKKRNKLSADALWIIVILASNEPSNYNKNTCVQHYKLFYKSDFPK